MENFNIEEYIRELPPELQEKAKACKSADELLALAGEKKIPLPDEALEAVAGGKDTVAGGKDTVVGGKYVIICQKEVGCIKSTDSCPKRSGNLPHSTTFVRAYNDYYIYQCIYCKMEFTSSALL